MKQKTKTITIHIMTGEKTENNKKTSRGFRRIQKSNMKKKNEEK